MGGLGEYPFPPDYVSIQMIKHGRIRSLNNLFRMDSLILLWNIALFRQAKVLECGILVPNSSRSGLRWNWKKKWKETLCLDFRIRKTWIAKSQFACKESMKAHWDAIRMVREAIIFVTLFLGLYMSFHLHTFFPYIFSWYVIIGHAMRKTNIYVLLVIYSSV